MFNFSSSQTLFQKAKNLIPGGVNSPVRAFRSVNSEPVYIKKANGAFLYDEDNNKYIDLINSWGPMILGHAFEPVIERVKDSINNSLSYGTCSRMEVDMAELICKMMPSIEKVRMVNSGTEACMSAIRLARGFTGKDKIIKFDGCYHGHFDSFLIAAGSGAATTGQPDSKGVTQGIAKDTLVARYNHIEDVKKIVEKYKGQIAAIIIEPVAGNMGLVLPQPNFLLTLSEICKKENCLLIFDEVMTGFRLSSGGAQKLYNIKPDLTTLGKIIGGGLPVGAYGGKKEIMDFVSPSGPVYQAGTLSGNPVTLTAGYSTLKYLYEYPEIYNHIEETTTKIVKNLKINFSKKNIKHQIPHIGSMFSVFFTDTPVIDMDSARKSDTLFFQKYFMAMLRNGVYLAPSTFESLFVSNAITDEVGDMILNAHVNALETIEY